MSPEQAMGVAIDFRADLYAMGILAFEVLTGRLPFTTEDMGEILQLTAQGKLLLPSAAGPVPPGFDSWFAKATAFRPKDRFGSAKELETALQDCLALAE